MKLPSIFVSFKQCLVESDGALKKHKEKFRSGLLQDADDFKKTVTDIVEVFETTGPFTSGSTCLLYTSPSPRDRQKSRMPSSA